MFNNRLPRFLRILRILNDWGRRSDDQMTGNVTHIINSMWIIDKRSEAHFPSWRSILVGSAFSSGHTSINFCLWMEIERWIWLWFTWKKRVFFSIILLILVLVKISLLQFYSNNLGQYITHYYNYSFYSILLLLFLSPNYRYIHSSLLLLYKSKQRLNIGIKNAWILLVSGLRMSLDQVLLWKSH